MYFNQQRYKQISSKTTGMPLPFTNCPFAMADKFLQFAGTVSNFQISNQLVVLKL